MASNPRAWKAALCIAGDSECATGSPSSRILLRTLLHVLLVLRQRLREGVITRAVALRDEEEEVGLGRLRGARDRRLARGRDRRRRESRIQVGVVRRVDLQVGERE